MSDATALAAWDPNSNAALPAYLAEAQAGLGSNIPDRQNVPSLSLEGKTWTIVKDGNKNKLQAVNGDGDMVPVPVMRMVVLKFNADRGRSYYTGTYNPAASTAPECWSADGIAPDESVKPSPEPGKGKQCSTCKACPQSVKGSKVVDGREMVACASHRMIAIAPAFDIASEPLRLKIPVTSDYDKDVVEHGWFAFRQYVDFLKSKGITNTALVVTKAKFDPTVAYPKVLFAVDKLLTPAEVTTVVAAVANPKVDELLAEKWSAAGVNGVDKSDSDIKPHGLEGAYLDGWQAHPDSAGWSYKGQQVLANDEVAALYPKPEVVIPKIPAAEQTIEHAPPPPPPVKEEAKAPPSAAHHDALAVATADGWAVHPTSPAHWFRGQEVVTIAEVEAKYPAPVAAKVEAAAPPPPPPPVVVDPMVAALAAGWAPHPAAPGYHYLGQEVVLDADLAARYAGNGASPATAGASAGSPSAATDAAPAGSTSGTTATSGASPSEGAAGAIPADVQGLLDKWTA